AEEEVLDAILLKSLARTFGVSDSLPLPPLSGAELIEAAHLLGPPLASLCAGNAFAPPWLCVEIDGRHATTAPPPQALLPGAFNPLHQGHEALAAEAARRLGCRIEFELSVVHADKGALTVEEVRHRLEQFVWRHPVRVTRAPTFIEKARLF